MLDLLLSIPDMLLTMGLPAIDQSLDKLLAAMETFPKAAVSWVSAVGFAKMSSASVSPSAWAATSAG
jgi:hypothetical protein